MVPSHVPAAAGRDWVEEAPMTPDPCIKAQGCVDDNDVSSEVTENSML